MLTDGTTQYGKIATCHNNCKGVDPSAIIGAGVAAVVATGVAAQAVLPVIGALGIGGLGAVGGGAAMELMRQQCQPGQCRVSSTFIICLQSKPVSHDDIMT